MNEETSARVGAGRERTCDEAELPLGRERKFEPKKLPSEGGFLRYQPLRKKGMMNTKQATRKNMLPAVAQKFPMLATINEAAESINKTHPKKSICRLLTFLRPSGFL